MTVRQDRSIQDGRRRHAGAFSILIALAVHFAACGIASAASGGPDGDGYTWRDSAEPGVTYAWEDISATGTDLVVGYVDDGNYGFQALGFPFPYYGTTYTQVAPCTNGWASPSDGTSTAFTNSALPSVGVPIGHIAAYWDDLAVTLGQSHVYFQDLGTRAVITWKDVHSLGATTETYTFQIVLYPSGLIAVQYQNMVGPTTDATMGIESPSELYGLTPYSDAVSGLPTANYRVEFSPPTPQPINLVCTGAPPIACGDRIVGNTATGVANQAGYRCSRSDYSGRELVYRMDLAAATTVRVILDTISGNPDMLILSACDPNLCVSPPSDRAVASLPAGTYYVVVDSAPGQEGQFVLRMDCNPGTTRLDCAGATFVSCNTSISGNLASGAANQNSYWCTDADYSGRELVYAIDFATPTDARFYLTSTSGNPDLIVLRSCNSSDCAGTPADSTTVTGATGTYYVVVDSAPGQEGVFNLRIDCNPVPNRVDCASATFMQCGDTVRGDLALGTAWQDIYWCSDIAYTGREQVYQIDLSQPADLLVDLTEITGDPDALLISACDPNNCIRLDSGSVTVPGASGAYFIVVDAPAGQEGQYDLLVDCLTDELYFCGGQARLETDPWGSGNGSWLVNGWLYHPGDTHNFALRVDDNPALTYEHEMFGACADFTRVSSGVRGLTGPAFVQWDAPEGNIREEFTQTSVGGCCGLLVNISVTNTDTVPHFYEFRTYHDTAFGVADGTGACGGTIDGGPIEVNGTRYANEIDLLAVGGDTCEGQIQMFTADHPAELRSSFQMLPPNLPSTMEWLDWDVGGTPCTAWKSLGTGQQVDQCSGFGGDSSLLFIWRFPQALGTLAPGETGRAAYRIGNRCPFPCNVACESPTLALVSAADVGPCNDGVRITWAAATFPGAGNGVYHLYRSTLSPADALLRAPITPLGGITQRIWLDDTTVPGQSYYYVLQAESLDFPNCGSGPVVSGSTAEANAVPQPMTDSADTTGPTSNVGGSLRALGHTPDTVNFLWPTAPLPGPGEQYVILRADDDPQGPFIQQASTPMQAWTDPAAPPRYVPVHVWFYDVRIKDACGNLSQD